VIILIVKYLCSTDFCRYQLNTKLFYMDLQYHVIICMNRDVLFRKFIRLMSVTVMWWTFNYVHIFNEIQIIMNSE